MAKETDVDSQSRQRHAKQAKGGKKWKEECYEKGKKNYNSY
jgi:hypothetical protein